MNITKENVDDLNALIKVEVVADDYEEKVNKVLEDHKKKANLKGFRPGRVPLGLIKKMYGLSVKVEEVNKVVSDSINKYIVEEKVEILGDPLPVLDKESDIDFENDTDFTFSFEIGLAPEFELNLTKKVKLPYYQIKIDEKLRKGFIDNYTRKFGDYSNSDIAGEEDILKVNIFELDTNSEIAENGRKAENSSLSVAVIKDEKIKKSVVGKKQGTSFDFDIRQAYPNDYEIAGLLQIDKEEAKNINGIFRAEINEITRFTPASVNQDLYDKVYGEGTIKSDEEFKEKIDSEIELQLKTESDYKAMLDVRKLAVEKCKFNLPEEFLKKWLKSTNKELSDEEIEKDFNHFLEDLRWQLIRNRIAKENEIKVEDEEVLEEARKFTMQQFQQYGLHYANDEQIDSFARDMLKKEDDQRKIIEKVLEEKVINSIKEMVKIDIKKVSTEEFNKLLNN